MKKLLALLLLSPFASADMDKICTVYVAEARGSYLDVEKQIRKKKCERNNVLELILGKEDEYTRESLLMLSNKFCRFDRNRSIERMTLSCILYSTRARKELIRFTD
tara:strand:+ start:15 stop:332 length:318 start_codon:yes stop_codon:yes gene_type:complete